MKKITLVLLATCTVAVFSCKKSSSSSTSIVGNWKMTSVSGKLIYGNYSSYDSTNYSYKSSDSIFTRVDFSTDPYGFDSTNFVISMNNWSFNADGTYSINEIYKEGTYPLITDNVSGVWQYLSNTSANDAVLLQGPTAALLPGGANSSYTFKVNGNTLTLTEVYAQRNTSNLQATDIVVTFSKM